MLYFSSSFCQLGAYNLWIQGLCFCQRKPKQKEKKIAWVQWSRAQSMLDLKWKAWKKRVRGEMCMFYNPCWNQQLSPLPMLVEHSQGVMLFKFLLDRGWSYGEFIKRSFQPRWQLCSPPPNTTLPLNSVIQLMPVMWGRKQMLSKTTLLMFCCNSSPHSSSSAELEACSACCWSLPALFSTHCSYICTYLPTPQIWSSALRHPGCCESSLSLCSCFAWLVHHTGFCPV